MQALKIAYMATGTVKNVTTIASHASKLSKSSNPPPAPAQNPTVATKIESDRYRLLVRKTLSTMHLLQTMLKRILESGNENLINDINEHRIIEKLENVENWMEEHKNRQFNTFNGTEKLQLNFVINETDFVYDQLKSLIMVNTITIPAVRL